MQIPTFSLPRKKIVSFLDACDAALDPVYVVLEAGLATWLQGCGKGNCSWLYRPLDKHLFPHRIKEGRCDSFCEYITRMRDVFQKLANASHNIALNVTYVHFSSVEGTSSLSPMSMVNPGFVSWVNISSQLMKSQMKCLPFTRTKCSILWTSTSTKRISF